MKVPIGEIQINEGRRGLDAAHVRELADSIRELGLLNPVTVDSENNLIAGLHRLEAVRTLGWDEVECTVSSLEGLQAELAEIDENFVRNGLSAIEYGEMLLRRKEIYEALHPETKAGIAQAAAMNRAVGNNVAVKMSATSKSFVEDECCPSYCKAGNTDCEEPDTGGKRDHEKRGCEYFQKGGDEAVTPGAGAAEGSSRTPGGKGDQDSG